MRKDYCMCADFVVILYDNRVMWPITNCGSVVSDMNSEYQIFTLGNGLRCVFRRSSGVGYCGVVVKAGSRDDGEFYGLAHFVEHTIFKGTAKRKARHISSRMESVGGELNAYTTKDGTVVYTAYPAGYSPRAMELLSDITSSSVFPEEELEKEREVVIDEINSYLDSPSESVFDEFEERLYAGNAPAHNVLGTPESVRALRREDCLTFLDRYYCAENLVVYCTDDCTPEQAYRNLDKYFGCLKRGAVNMRDNLSVVSPRFDETVEKCGHQAHTVIGARISHRDDENRYALFLLNNHLGGVSMNSLLNRELREKRGYVYTVDSSVCLFDGCGSIQVYFGCDPEHVTPCCRIVKKLLCRLAESPMKSAVFEKARRQYLGQLIVSGDNRESQAMSMGRSLQYYGEVHDIAYAAERIREVSAEQVRAMAEKILDSGLSRLTLM